MPDETTEERKQRLYREGMAAYEPPPDEPTDPEIRAMAIVDCGLCDDDGYRCGGTIVCDHVDRTDTAARGIALTREVLDAINARRGAR